jgi:hypothetical protein
MPDHSQAPWNTHWSKLCQHELRPRLKQYKTGLRAKMQCVKCGQGVGANVSMSGVSEPWDDLLEQKTLDDYERCAAEYRLKNEEFMKAQRGERSAAWWQIYNAYLRSEEWAAKRERVMWRCGGICESCGDREARHVHHLEYPKTFGLEPLYTLVGVCVPCHKIIHPHMDR